ncbi:unnamed protein product [Adineta steineri]|uniref:Rap-GAP domain-containing protein n=1 Tax=Adineta steineri TaxID=433720 RepID=A0A814ZUT6_9BILA|nr:unnamed protein product [Adineta steineri]CAF3845744.1 unnamed protein product [Adineta steineri]
MDELNSNRNDKTTVTNSEESSFILQSNLNDSQHNENYQYKLKAPLGISQAYEKDFFDNYHINYCGKLEHEGLFIASIRSIPIEINDMDNKSTSDYLKINNDEEEHQLVRALIRTMNNNYDVSDTINIKNEKNILHSLFQKAQLSSIQHYEIIHHIKANEKILEFDKYIDDQYSNKIGFIFQRLNQTNENEILSNNDMSIEMKNFLNSISERIELKDFNKYRGDLDIKTNEHGLYSYFTFYENHQIMFNIAPIIPSEINDKEFIHRKGLIGNALLCIVFQEVGSRFQPDFILGKMIQVYITVQPMEINSQLHYKIEIWRRCDIEPIDKPSGGIYKHDETFRNYFLTLILNTMNIILKKDVFQLRIVNQRERSKNEFIARLSQFFSSYSFQQNNNIQQIDVQESDDEHKSKTSNSHRYKNIIPKIKETFSNSQLKQHHSAPNTGMLTKPSSANMKRNSWNSLVPTPQSNNDHESFLSIVNRILRQQDTSKSEPLSIKSVSLLVPNKIDPIESNTEKTSTNNTNSSTENKEYTDVSLANNNEELTI